MSHNRNRNTIASRFRGLLPVVVDVETTGLDPANNGLLEIAAITLKLDSAGLLCPDKTYAYQVEPFEGAIIDPEALAITGIDPGYPLRFAVPEKHALHCLFSKVKQQVEADKCRRAVLVGHNAWFDLAFILAGAKRSGLEFNPFHSFTTFDTATLSAVALGETVLAKAARAIKLPFDVTQAHSAIYDAMRTAELFCYIANHKIV